MAHHLSTRAIDFLGREYDYIPDGVYIDLDDEDYFGQEALGSTDLIKLWKLRHGWWWQSRWNPDHVDKPSKERVYGHAAHAIVLEGVDAYKARFAVLPDRPAGVVETVPEMRDALQRANYDVSRGTSSWLAADWAAAMANYLPHVPCWPNILADALEHAGKRTLLSAVDDRMMRVLHDTAMGNPDIAKLFGTASGFPPLAEVAVLKTLPDGTRRRWKFDRLFPSFTLDLKTLGNWSGRPLKFAVGDLIAEKGYEIQRADYDAGREALNAFVRDGFNVHGGTPEQRHFLLRMVEHGGSWDWVWLFYQKPDPVGRAPVLFPLMDEHGSALQQYGRAKAAKAMTFYRDMLAKFGPTTPWTDVEELHFTDEARIPNVTFPHWISEDEPTGDPGAYPPQEVAA